LLRKLTEHPSMSERATAPTNASGPSVSNTIELLVAREAQRLGITVSRTEVEACVSRSTGPDEPAAEAVDVAVRAGEEFFGVRSFSG
jgi:hypothetical protein